MLRPDIFEPIGPFFFERVFHDFFGNELNHFDRINIDIIDDGDCYLLQAELPGFQKEEITLHLNQDILKISACHATNHKSDETNYIRQERCCNTYKRSFHIPQIIKEDIAAFYENGILEIKLPKAPGTVNGPQQIMIK